MKTLAAWIKANPGVNALAFERNADKSFGFGRSEEVCGFCLASHYFDGEPPERCKFCRALLRESHVVANFPEITSRAYSFTSLSDAPAQHTPKSLFLVPQGPKQGP